MIVDVVVLVVVVVVVFAVGSRVRGSAVGHVGVGTMNLGGNTVDYYLHVPRLQPGCVSRPQETGPL